MSNIIDYIDWRGDVTLRVAPFNEVDALVLTQLAMIDLEGIVPCLGDGEPITVESAASLFFADRKRSGAPLGLIIPREIITMFKKMGKSQRFSKMRLCGYVNSTDRDSEQQFSALTVRVGDGSFFVAFRGTDDTLVGWKEDLNLAFMPSIPSQIEAVSYFDRIGRMLRGRVRVGGHSKGGNLAVFAAVKCRKALRDRIIEVYNFDGPGFGVDFIKLEAYHELEDRIKTVLPESSVVGMLFDNGKRYSVVKSSEMGIFQHNAISWECCRDGFKRMPELCAQSIKAATQINLLIADLDNDARRRFADAVYAALTSTEASTLTELYENRFAVLRSLGKADKATRRLAMKLLGILVSDGNGQLLARVMGAFLGVKNTKKDAKKNAKKGRLARKRSATKLRGKTGK